MENPGAIQLSKNGKILRMVMGMVSKNRRNPKKEEKRSPRLRRSRFGEFRGEHERFPRGGFPPLSGFGQQKKCDMFKTGSVDPYVQLRVST